MEALYEGMTEIPIQAVSFEGYILLILIVLAVIFKLRILYPKK